MKRKRHVGDIKFVATSWATQDRWEARTDHRSMSFAGPHLFSYQTQIGRIYKNAEGDTLAVVDSTNWSSTSRRHQRAALSACRAEGLETVEIDFGRVRRSKFPEPEEILPRMVELAAKLQDWERRKRVAFRKEWYGKHAQKTIDNMKLVAGFFKLPSPSIEDVFHAANQMHELQKSTLMAKRSKLAAWKSGTCCQNLEDCTCLRSHKRNFMRPVNGSIQFSKNTLALFSVDAARTIVLQWMYDQGFRQPWSFCEQIMSKYSFGRWTYKLVPYTKSDNLLLVTEMLRVGPEECIKFFKRHNLLEGNNGAESPALEQATA